MVEKKKPREFNITIGKIGISFVFDQNLFDDKVKQYKNEFAAQNRAEIKLNIHRGNIPENGKKIKIFDSEYTWCFYYQDGKYVLQNHHFESNPPGGRFVILNPDFKSGDIYLNEELSQLSPFDPLKYPLNQVLMIILLSLRKGVLLHASGIDDGKRGYLFLGNSTHGKSTMAKLWYENHATVLNDDRIIVREKDGEFWMYGTPWHGTFNKVSPNGLPIRKIFFLRHGEKNSAVPRKGAEAVSMLLTRAFPPLWDQKGMDYTLGLLDRMANKLPCYELHFLPDKRVFDFVRNI